MGCEQMNDDKDSKPRDQGQKFKDAARDLGCDEDEGRWDERLRKVVRPKPRRGGK